MKVQAHVVLMATTFVPVAVFKIIARTGDASLGRARLAAVTGLVLALIQFWLSSRFLKTTTYLERAFLGFLLVAAGWLYVAPAPLSMPFVMHATTMLYIVLFLTTLVPQLAGYDPFTYAIAKHVVSGERLEHAPVSHDQLTHHVRLERGLFGGCSVELAGVR